MFLFSNHNYPVRTLHRSFFVTLVYKVGSMVVPVTQTGRRIKQAFRKYHHENIQLTKGRKCTIRNSLFLALLVWIFSYYRPAFLSFADTNYCHACFWRSPVQPNSSVFLSPAGSRKDWCWGLLLSQLRFSLCSHELFHHVAHVHWEDCMAGGAEGAAQPSTELFWPH